MLSSQKSFFNLCGQFEPNPMFNSSFNLALRVESLIEASQKRFATRRFSLAIFSKTQSGRRTFDIGTVISIRFRIEEIFRLFALSQYKWSHSLGIDLA
jgi:hypothetical protein